MVGDGAEGLGAEGIGGEVAGAEADGEVDVLAVQVAAALADVIAHQIPQRGGGGASGVRVHGAAVEGRPLGERRARASQHEECRQQQEGVVKATDQGRQGRVARDSVRRREERLLLQFGEAGVG